jgi:hypothetical protein
MQKVIIVLAAVLLVLSGSASMANSRRAVHHGHTFFAPVPQDPQAYAMWVARQTWGPNVPLCATTWPGALRQERRSNVDAERRDSVRQGAEALYGSSRAVPEGKSREHPSG